MKAIIFDIDNTLTSALSAYPKAAPKKHPQDVIVLPGVLEGMKFHHEKGYTMVGASNQGGCTSINPQTGKPYKTIEDTILEMEYTLSLLPYLEIIYFCPDIEGRECYAVSKKSVDKTSVLSKNKNFWNYRKPGAGMLTKAAIDYDFDLSQSWMIGDRSEDMEAANNANCEFMDAETWRMRFTPGIHKLNNVSLKQIDLLEGVKYSVK